jgi:hypothetical protein
MAEVLLSLSAICTLAVRSYLDHPAHFPIGDSVIRTTTVIAGIHNSTQSTVEPLLFKTPPTRCPLTLSSFF